MLQTRTYTVCSRLQLFNPGRWTPTAENEVVYGSLGCLHCRTRSCKPQHRALVSGTGTARQFQPIPAEIRLVAASGLFRNRAWENNRAPAGPCASTLRIVPAPPKPPSLSRCRYRDRSVEPPRSWDISSLSRPFQYRIGKCITNARTSV